jgi:hypothetical protein
LSLGCYKHILSKISNNDGHSIGLDLTGEARIVIDRVDYEFATQLISGKDISLINLGNQSFLYIGAMNLINPPTEMMLIKDQTVGRVHIGELRTNNPNYEFRKESDEWETVIDNIVINGQGEAAFNFIYTYDYIRTSWLSGRNYPTLSTFLPDLVTPWSVRVDFGSEVVLGRARKTWQVTNFYDQAEEEKTLTIELLIYDVLTDVRNNEFFAMFTYIDSTGISRTESTRNSELMTVSDAAWNASLYGPVNFNKKKMQLTTKHPIKSGTLVRAITYCNFTVPDTETFNFINPEIVIS